MNDKIKELKQEIKLIKNLSSGNDPKTQKLIAKLEKEIELIKNLK